MPGSAAWCATAASSIPRCWNACPTAACSPAARRSTSSSIDELGDEQAAINWLAKEKNIDPNTPVRDYRLQPRFGDLPFLHVATIGLLDVVGLTSVAERLKEWGTIQAVERLNLDGLLALWHPPSTN